MPRYIISIGSNLPTGKEEVLNAIEMLRQSYRLTAATEPYTSPDIRDASAPRYTNATAIIDTEIELEDLNRRFKEYEKERGRQPGVKDVPADLDIVCCEDKILRPRDYNAPYFVEGLYMLYAKG